MKKNKNNIKLNNKKIVVYLDLTNPNKTIQQAIDELKAELGIVNEAAHDVAIEMEATYEVTKKAWYKKAWQAIKSLF